ncbi:DNA ligase 1 [Nematocida ausubeli]|nr:DNA ligase 1 [Nematocida ausubeli]
MHATWAQTAQCFEALSRISARKEIIKQLAEYYATLDQEELIYAVYLSIARVSSESNGVEMNIGENILLKALSTFSSSSVDALRKKMKESGDISTIVTVSSRPRLFFAKKKTLSLAGVFVALKEISELTGKESTLRKTQRIAEILTQCTANEEVKYIIRIIDGKMKIGLSTQTVLCSLALAFRKKFPDGAIPKENCAEKEKEGSSAETAARTVIIGAVDKEGQIEWSEEENKVMDDIKEAYSQLPSFDKIIRYVFSHGLSAVSTTSLIRPGYPLRPMLAIPEKDPETVAARFKGEYLVEHKYDGERVQAHFFDGKVELFSRGLENTTERFNQLTEPLMKANKTGVPFILDAEVVAYCRKTKKILSFQTLSNRKRKITESNADREESDIALFIFDLLFLENSLNKLPIQERKRILKESFSEAPGEIFIAESYKFTEHNTERLNAIFADALAGGCEGIMVKSADAESTYEPSKRSQKWIKLKSDYITGLFETLDLLVIGGYTGKGKRTGVYGGFLLGCMNEDGIVQTITKIGTGFSEAVLEELSKEMQEHTISIPQTEITPGSAPDVWFKPVAVWEVAAAGFSVSPQYTAGMGAIDLPDGKGISLRFPRFIRARKDKTPETSTSSEQIMDMFRASQQ